LPKSYWFQATLWLNLHPPVMKYKCVSSSGQWTSVKMVLVHTLITPHNTL